MDDLRLPAVAARLVAWHNSQPLARRISAANVHGIGYVALPFVGEAAAAPPAVPGEAGDAAAPAAQVRLQEAEAPAADAAAQASPAGALTPDFSATFIDTLKPRQVARFAAKHGQVLACAAADGPLRQIRADGRHAGRAPVTVYLLTAVIETATRKSRVLLGAGTPAPVLGRRILDGPRQGAVAAVLLAGAAAVGWTLQPGAERVAVRPASVASAASAAPASFPASVVSAASAGPAASAPPAALAADAAASTSQRPQEPAAAVPQAAASAVPAAAAPAVETAAAPAPSPAPAPAAAQASAPASAVASASARPGKVTAPAIARLNDVVPHLDRIGIPSIRPQLSAAARPAARPPREPAPAETAPEQAPAQPGAASAGRATVRAAAPATTPASAPSAPPAVAATASAPHQNPATFAVSTRSLRTRAEADQVRVAMMSLLRSVAGDGFKVEVLPQGDDWRVVGWSFPQRTDADKARALLVSRGMRVEVVGF